MKNDYEIRDDVTVIFVKCKKRILETFIDTKDLDKARSFSNTWYAHFNQKTNSFYIRGIKLSKEQRDVFIYIVGFGI
ncbi:hypothetical protein [Halalkalibacter krulwichiae]|uniref:Uncharacterized protein n=1 Tax=Halalkalibacter krulwichiae TaxID=199441 RepID=A0A1X9MFD3_9BACI|nr:hypothetical protein [Halalkalibacter krulwichiae]ARK32159.1 hypothetical protein BkAM31D_21200 [Halalkalibacter krulwichiae]